MTPIKYHNTAGDRQFRGEKFMVFGNAIKQLLLVTACLKSHNPMGQMKGKKCVWGNGFISINHFKIMSLKMSRDSYLSILRPITHMKHSYSRLIQSCQGKYTVIEILKMISLQMTSHDINMKWKCKKVGKRISDNLFPNAN